MPLPEGHWRSVNAPRARLRTRERWLLGVVLTCVAALAIGFVISLASHSPTSGHGCISVTVQGPVGGTQLRRCGAEARGLCASTPATATQSALQRAVAAECRRAGLPVGT